MIEHELKTLPKFFKVIEDGQKTFEIRKNDRNFQVGDVVILKEFSSSKGYTGRELIITITYVTNYRQKKGYVVFGFVEY